MTERDAMSKLTDSAQRGSAPTYRGANESAPADSLGSTLQQRAAALDFLRNLAVEVSSGSVDLPCFPDVVGRISQTLSNSATTAAQVVVVVGSEPRLAARILQTANSAAFNITGKPLTDLRAAITRLGHYIVQGIAISFAMQRMNEDATLRSIREPLTQLWDASMLMAALCQRLAARTRVNAEAAFLTGLLHGIGSLYIMARSATLKDNDADLNCCLHLVAGWMAPIGKAVLESWNFDEALCDAVGNQADLGRKWRHDAELSDILIVATLLAEHPQSSAALNFSIAGIGAFSTLGVRSEECVSLVNEAALDVVRVRDVLGFI